MSSSTPDKKSLEEVTSNSSMNTKPPAATISPVDSETLKRAAAMMAKITRGVTMRPSGKWQAQFYYAGKSRYIGVFDTREKAALSYEIVRERLKSKRPTALSLIEVDEIFSSAAHSAELACPNDGRKNEPSSTNDGSQPPSCTTTVSSHHAAAKPDVGTVAAKSTSQVYLPKNHPYSVYPSSIASSFHSNDTANSKGPISPSASLLTAKARGLKRNHPSPETYRFLFYKDKMKTFADGCVIVSQGHEILRETLENLIEMGDSNVKKVFSLTPHESLQIQRKEAEIQVLCGNAKFTLETFRGLVVCNLLSMFAETHEISIVVVVESVKDEEENLSYVFSKASSAESQNN